MRLQPRCGLEDAVSNPYRPRLGRLSGQLKQRAGGLRRSENRSTKQESEIIGREAECNVSLRCAEALADFEASSGPWQSSMLPNAAGLYHATAVPENALLGHHTFIHGSLVG